MSEFEDKLAKSIEIGVKKAAIHLQGKVREKINREQDIRGTGVNRRGEDPSSPGEAPKRVSGQLVRSIAFETEGSGEDTVGRVGTNLPYGRMLEEGTSEMEARPYLRNTLIEEGDAIMQIILDSFGG